MKNPKLISKPFAQNGQKNVIPEKYETSMESNQATWDQGFGQITMLPVSAGGLPPKGQDFNGILNQMCESIVHISKGGVFKFSTDYATAINGYPKGAILQSEDEKKYYQSLIDNNKVNFNTASQEQIKTSWKLVMTDDLLDQLSKKLESSAVVQSTGTSTTSVMSQKASMDAFQPKGTYPTTSEMNVELNKKVDKANISQQLANDVNKVPSLDLVTKELGKKQQTGDYATSTALKNGLEGKLDKSSVSQTTGASTTSVMSQDAATKEFMKFGDYGWAGTKGVNASYSDTNSFLSYLKTATTKTQVMRNETPTGVSAGSSPVAYFRTGDTFMALTAAFFGSSVRVIAGNNESQFVHEIYTDRNTSKDKNGFIRASGSADTLTTGNVAQFAGASTENVMSQKACVDYFQKKGDYQPAGNYALKSELNDIELVPHPIPWSLPTAPSGYLIYQGQTFNKATYPKLAIAYPSGRLPDLRGEFIRGADAGRGIDVGREILSNQLGNSLLSTNLMEVDAPNFKQYKKVVEWIGNTGTNASTGYGIWQQIEGQNGNETRPRNIAFLYIVRAA